MTFKNKMATINKLCMKRILIKKIFFEECTFLVDVLKYQQSILGSVVLAELFLLRAKLGG